MSREVYLREYLDVFTQHADRITSLYLRMDQYDPWHFHDDILPIILTTKSGFPHLLRFHLDFSGDHWNSGRSEDDFLLHCMQNSRQLTHLELNSCEVLPSTIVTLSGLTSLSLPGQGGSDASAQEWRAMLAALSGTLEHRDMETVFIQSEWNTFPIVDLKRVDKLTLRGELAALERALAGFRTPMVRHLSLFQNRPHPEVEDFFPAWAKITNQQMIWPHMQHQSKWALWIDSGGVCLRTPDSAVTLWISAGWAGVDDPEDIEPCFNTLEHRTRHHIVELHALAEECTVE
jgi:hypothetical protein